MQLQNLDESLKMIVHDIVVKQVIKHYQKKGFKDKQDFANFIEYGFRNKVIIPDKCNCGKNHSTPLDFMHDVISGKVRDFIVWTNRTGSKTFFSGLITWILASFNPNMDVRILGGSGDQSERAYQAMGFFWDITKMQPDYLAKPPMMKKTEWQNKSYVEILMASSTSVRGPHPNFLLLDEVDEIDIDIYNAAMSQPMSKNDIPQIIGQLSTNHKQSGTMDHALAMAEQDSDSRIYKWCIWECLESCKDYVCSTCKLSPYCPGQHMKTAAGYYKISDFIKKLSKISENGLQTEWFCNKTGSPDLVYFNEYDQDIHVIDRNYSKTYPVYLSIDWGGTHPFSVGVWQSFPDIGWVRVDEIYMPNCTNPQLLKECKSREWWTANMQAIADPSRSDLKQEWAELGVSLFNADNNIDQGIEAVKAALKPVLGNPQIHFNKKCVHSQKEFYSYCQRNGRIVKENDHSMDEIRYFVMWKLNDKRGGKIEAYKSQTMAGW